MNAEPQKAGLQRSGLTSAPLKRAVLTSVHLRSSVVALVKEFQQSELARTIKSAYKLEERPSFEVLDLIERLRPRAD